MRFHCGSRGRGGNYPEAELSEWADRVRAFRANGDVYCYFNNDGEGYAVANGSRLRALVEGKATAARGCPA